jgi:hypothetical protein
LRMRASMHCSDDLPCITPPKTSVQQRALANRSHASIQVSRPIKRDARTADPHARSHLQHACRIPIVILGCSN